MMKKGKQVTLLEMIKECEDEQCIENVKKVKRELNTLKKDEKE